MIRDGVLGPDPVWTSPTPPGQAAMRCTWWPSIRSSRKTGSSTSPIRSGATSGNTLAVARGRLNGDKLEDVKEIFVADAWETSGNLAGHMFFGPDARSM